MQRITTELTVGCKSLKHFTKKRRHKRRRRRSAGRRDGGAHAFQTLRVRPEKSYLNTSVLFKEEAATIDQTLDSAEINVEIVSIAIPTLVARTITRDSFLKSKNHVSAAG